MSPDPSGSEWAAPAPAARWTNWGGNQDFPVGVLARPEGEDQAVELVQAALRSGRSVRAAGSGHSYTPIVETDGLLLDLSRLSGVLATDPARNRATVLAGTTIAEVGAPLWDAGLALANQGDVDAQTLSGAVATGTKGSGPAFGSLSSALRGVRLVTGRGEVLDVGEDDLDLLRAAQVSIGMLGVMTRLELEVVPRYRLAEENRVLSWAELREQWDDLLTGYRHFSFWWCGSAGSAAMYDLGDVPADHCAVKLLREAEPDEPTATRPPGARVDRSHRIYPDGTTEARFHELEYMVPAHHAEAAIEVLRALQLERFGAEISPLQVRWQAADDGLLSPQHGRPSVSLSLSGVVGTDYVPFLRAVDAALRDFEARPHWGKIHYLDAARVRALYPRLDAFQALRRRLDPEGRFLNAHLRELFGA